jgi:hypothetical protein
VQLLHLAALWTLAVAQPLLDVLGNNAEFFAIRRSEPEDIVVLAIGLVLIPPLLLFAVEALAARVDARAGRVAHLVLVGGLCGLLALLVLKRTGASSAVLVPLCALAGAGAAAVYARVEAVRSILTVLAAAPVVVVVLFLFTTPVERLVTGGEAEAALAADGGRAPVVMLVLDELPITSLLGSDGRIDARRYPNFAALAGDALWFRNTATVDSQTQVAVPAILTGRLPRAGQLPTAADQPQNLFTLLGRGRELHVHEPVSDLCPERLCPDDAGGEGFGGRMRSLVSDLEVVGLHVLLPDDLRRRLPSIDQRWQDFRGGEDDAQDGREQVQEEFGAALERERSDRPGLFDRFVDAMPRPRADAPGPLSLLHVLLPHVPWEHTPDGRRYSRGNEQPGLDFETWSPDAGAAQAGYERHLLEVGAVDRLLGRLLRRLREDGTYDDTLLVVTADHGVSMRPGLPRRSVRRETAQDLLPVPFFLKRPGQRRGRVIDRHLQTIDVLPTIADALGVRAPWRMDGVSGLQDGAGRRTLRATNAGAEPFEIGAARLDVLRRAALRRQVALLGEGGPPRLRTPHAAGLEGRRVGAAGPAPAGMSATVDDPAGYADVDLGAPTLPLHVSGSVRGAVDEVAIAVNGRIAAVRSVFRDQEERRFSAIVARSLLRDGANLVEILGVRRRGGAVDLVRLGRAGGRDSLYTLAGGTITGPGGRRYRIAAGRLAGAVDRSVRDADLVNISGWAAQADGFKPVNRVVGFGGGRLLSSASPSLDRPDVADAHGVPPAGLGWQFAVVEAQAEAKPRVFALHDGVASELGWICGDGARQDVGC